MIATHLIILLVECDDTCCPGFEGGTTSERQCCRATDCSVCSDANSTLTAPGAVAISLVPIPVPHCAQDFTNSGNSISCSFACSASGNKHDFVFHQVVSEELGWDLVEKSRPLHVRRRHHYPCQRLLVPAAAYHILVPTRCQILDFAERYKIEVDILHQSGSLRRRL
jgi:hypothetical protein